MDRNMYTLTVASLRPYAQIYTRNPRMFLVQKPFVCAHVGMKKIFEIRCFSYCTKEVLRFVELSFLNTSSEEVKE